MPMPCGLCRCPPHSMGQRRAPFGLCLVSSANRPTVFSVSAVQCVPHPFRGSHAVISKSQPSVRGKGSPQRRMSLSLQPWCLPAGAILAPLRLRYSFDICSLVPLLFFYSQSKNCGQTIGNENGVGRRCCGGRVGAFPYKAAVRGGMQPRMAGRGLGRGCW